MNILAPAFLIRSSSFLQVTRTYMKAWTSLNFNQIPPPSPELSALARLKNCCEHSSAYIFSSPEPKAQGELIVDRSSRPLSVCLAVCLWTFSNSNVSTTSGPIVTKF